MARFARGIANHAHELPPPVLEELVSLCKQWGTDTEKVLQNLGTEPSKLSEEYQTRLVEYRDFWNNEEPVLRSQIAENLEAQRLAEEADRGMRQPTTAPEDAQTARNAPEGSAGHESSAATPATAEVTKGRHVSQHSIVWQ